MSDGFIYLIAENLYPLLLTHYSLFAVRERLTAAHMQNDYRCFLPDLTRFTPACCAGPLPDCKKSEYVYAISVHISYGTVFTAHNVKKYFSITIQRLCILVAQVLLDSAAGGCLSLLYYKEVTCLHSTLNVQELKA